MKQTLWLVLCVATLFLSPGAPIRAQGDADKPPQPSLQISFERDTLRENEPLPVVLWVANDSAQDLSNTQLHIAAPEFLNWHEGDCGKQEISPPLALGPIPANSSLSRQLCAEFTDGRVGEFNLLFTLEYEWEQAQTTYQSFVSEEKTLKTDVFGTDSLLGIPLAFAGFVVPGLVLFYVLRLCKVPLKLASDERLIFSVAASILIMWLAWLLRGRLGWPILDHLNFSAEVSTARLVALALAGFVCGLLVSAGYAVYAGLKRRKQRAEAAKQIRPDDDDATVLRKMLELNPSYDGSGVRVRTTEEEEFSGSHYAESGGYLYLAGSFFIEKQALSDEVRARISDCLDAAGELIQEPDKLLKVMEVVADVGDAPIQIRDPIERIQGVQRTPTDRERMSWPAGEVSAKEPDNSRREKLLVLA